MTGQANLLGWNLIVHSPAALYNLLPQVPSAIQVNLLLMALLARLSKQNGSPLFSTQKILSVAFKTTEITTLACPTLTIRAAEKDIQSM